MPAESEKHVRLGTLRVTSTRVEELDQSRVIVALDRKDLLRIRAAWARRSENPLLQLLLAAACCIFGAFVIINTVLWLHTGGTRDVAALMCVLLLPVGCWLGYDALRRGPILLLETSRRRRRLTFGGQVQRQQLLAFVDEANREFGYTIEIDDSLKR